MASPPFNIAETTPGDSDIVSQFPAAERTFRDIVEDWITVEHNTYGYHKLQSLTTTERDAITDWSIGGLIYNETLKQLQFTLSVDPDVWYSEGVPTGTRAPFQQTAAPTGWTKESSASYNDAVMISTTGSVATAGTVAASTLFARTATDSVTLTQANLPSGINLSHSLTAATHTHTFSGTTNTTGAHTHNHTAHGGNFNAAGGASAVSDNDDAEIESAGDHSHTFSGTTGSSGSLAVSGTVSLGGSSTSFSPAIDMRVKRFSCIIATKD